MKTIGILAVQGGFALHIPLLSRLGFATRLVGSPKDLDRLEGLVLPGGESTAQLHAIERLALEAPLASFLTSGRPVLATCAGLILIASSVQTDRSKHEQGRSQKSFGVLEAVVARNAWGSQVESFEAMDDAGVRKLVFIRAPRISSTSHKVVSLATFRGEPVLLRQGSITAATYHPELADDLLLYEDVFGPVRPTT